MYKIKVNNKKEFVLNDLKADSVNIDGNDTNFDLIKTKEGAYHMLINNQSYNVDVVKLDTQEKQITLKVNGTKYTLEAKDKFDLLLHNLGMDNLASKKVNDVKAPMPGLVLNILAIEGNEVKKGDALLVLEAMKMENIIKSPADGIVKKINVSKGNAVEKNQILIQF